MCSEGYCSRLCVCVCYSTSYFSNEWLCYKITYILAGIRSSKIFCRFYCLCLQSWHYRQGTHSHCALLPIFSLSESWTTSLFYPLSLFPLCMSPHFSFVALLSSFLRSLSSLLCSASLLFLCSSLSKNDVSDLPPFLVSLPLKSKYILQIVRRPLTLLTCWGTVSPLPDAEPILLVHVQCIMQQTV